MTLATRRRGLSLTEVLVTLFIVALGLISLQTLFPLGAYQMAQAVKDDRCAFAHQTAATEFRVLWKDLWEQVNQKDTSLTNDDLRDVDQNFFALDDPYAPFVAGPDASPAAGTYTATTHVPHTGAINGAWPQPVLPLARVPSWPVLIDPYGFMNHGGLQQYWVAGLKPGIPRRGVNSVFAFDVPNPFGAPQRVRRLYSLSDDLSFVPTGEPEVSSPGLLGGSEGRYNWAYMVRRPNNKVRDQVELTVIVYGHRAIDLPMLEQFYPTTWVPNQNSVAISFNPAVSASRPRIRRGWWVLDATTDLLPGDAYGVHADFYRVVDYAEEPDLAIPGNILMRIEVETPIKRQSPTSNPPAPARDDRGTLVILDKVAEVIDRGVVSTTTLPAP